MSDRDFSIGNRQFKISKLDPFKQFHILRRLAPLLANLGPIADKISKSSDPSKQFDSLAPIMNGISSLSDADSNFVLMGLLSAVEMQQSPGGWSQVVKNDTLMFHDLDLPMLMQIAWRAFEFNLAGFLAGNPPVSTARG